MPAKTARKPPAHRPPPTVGPRALRAIAPGWSRYCGFCANVTPVATNGRMLLCQWCGQ